jgi:molybdopterin-containing oxidoreductase family membrane subunit
MNVEPRSANLLTADMTEAEVSRRVFAPLEELPRRRLWWALFTVASLLLCLYGVTAVLLFWHGVGLWGNDEPVHWGFGILNYIWWLGIGHAGTFISALLLLLNRPWRHSLNRLAELMTLMAVICAAFYPILHLGRPWLFFWTLPYPNEMGLWPQLKSPTAWDLFAVLSYLLVSLLFLYLGCIPDFASARDRASRRWKQVFYGLLALGWRGSQRHWALWERTSRSLAIIAIALVFAVSSGYSFLMALGSQSGWHSTLFPPYFVAGAVFSGFALVTLIAVALRRFLGLQALITSGHFDLLGRLLLATGWMTAYGYLSDLFIAFYSGEAHDIEVAMARLTGPAAWSWWLAIVCNLGVLQALWWRRVRCRPGPLALVAAAVLLGMWAERYMLLIVPQTRDYLAASWGGFTPSLTDWALFVGSFGLFLVPFLLFVRFVPMVSAFEVKQTLRELRHG